MPVNKYGVDVDELRQEMADIERRSAKGPYWTPEQAKNIVRVLPASPGEGKKFFFKIHTHWVNSRNTSYPCLNKMRGEKCFFCEKETELRQAGETKEANNFKATTRYLMQLIDRKHPEAGVQIYNAGSTVFKGIVALLDDEDWGPTMLDLQKGFDVVIERTGQGLDTKYPSIRARKDPSPAGIKVSDLLDLEKIPVFYTYEEMQATQADSIVEALPEPQKDEAPATTAPSGKPACYGKYNPDDPKCASCEYNFDCEIDTVVA